jgi:hypothetical protein
MPAPIATTAARVRVSSTAGGAYAVVGYVRSADVNRGSEGNTTLRWFGGDAVRQGNLTLEGTVPVWWDSADTAGQDVLTAAYANRTSVFLQFAPEGTAAGAKVKQFQATITEAAFNFDSEGDAVEGSFSFTGVPSTFTTVTLV